MGKTIRLFEDDTMNLVVDLGLFHLRLSYGPTHALEPVKERFSKLIAPPLEILPDEKLKGVCVDSSIFPNEIELFDDGSHVPDIFQ